MNRLRVISLVTICLGILCADGDCAKKRRGHESAAANESIGVARVLSSEIRVSPPMTHADQGTESEAYREALAGRTLEKIVPIVIQHLTSNAVSEAEEEAGIELYAHLHAAGIPDAQLVEAKARDIKVVTQLIHWYDEHGEGAIPNTKELIEYRMLYPSARSATDYLRALESGPTVVAVFGSIGRDLFYEVVAAEQIKGPGSLSVSDEELAQHREEREQWGFSGLDDKYLRLIVKHNKAGLIIYGRLLEMIRSGEIEIYDQDIRERIRTRLAKRSAH